METPDNLNRITHSTRHQSQRIQKHWLRTLKQWLGRLAISFFAISIFSVLILRWVNPPTTSFMLQRQYNAWHSGEEPFELKHEWVNWKNISSTIKMAAITSEDQNFAQHWGIDLDSIGKAIDEYERGQDLRGASTITQQVAKNLFLWPTQSYIRKGVEAYFALLIELLWSKERILEMYLNIVEFGDGVYGVQAAAKHFFDTSAANLSKWQSALMVTALPAPKRYNLANPSQYMLHRRTWVLRYMNLLGNGAYLEKLE